jgi:hypothetical protein
LIAVQKCEAKRLTKAVKGALLKLLEVYFLKDFALVLLKEIKPK